MNNLKGKPRFTVNDCFATILLIGLCALVGNLWDFSRMKLECGLENLEKIKKDTVPQQMKDGTIINGLDTLKFDTLKIEKRKKSHISWLKEYKQKIIERNQNVR